MWFSNHLVEQFGPPRMAITGKLHSYIKSVRYIALEADLRAQKELNNASEVAHPYQ